MVVRDGVPLRQAGHRLRTSGATSLSDRELAALLSKLPKRTPLRPSSAAADELADTPGGARADDLVDQETALHEREWIRSSIETILARLSDEERLIVRLRFWEEASIAQIARALAKPQKPLYRQFTQLLAKLRRLLEMSGISREEAQALTDLAVDARPAGVASIYNGREDGIYGDPAEY
jgi:RNA polymerase sigma factor (sigma-70 family)